MGHRKPWGNRKSTIAAILLVGDRMELRLLSSEEEGHGGANNVICRLPETRDQLRTGSPSAVFGNLQFLLLVLRGLVLAAFMPSCRRRGSDLGARAPLDLLAGSEWLLLA